MSTLAQRFDPTPRAMVVAGQMPRRIAPVMAERQAGTEHRRIALLLGVAAAAMTAAFAIVAAGLPPRPAAPLPAAPRAAPAPPPPPIAAAADGAVLDAAEAAAAQARIDAALAAARQHAALAARLAEADAALAAVLAARLAPTDLRQPPPALQPVDEPPQVLALAEPALAQVEEPPQALALAEPALALDARQFPAAADLPSVPAAIVAAFATGQAAPAIVPIGVLRVPRPIGATDREELAIAPALRGAPPPAPAMAPEVQAPPHPVPAQGMRAFIHHAGSPAAAARLADRLPPGIALAEIRPVRATPSAGDVRFFFAADRPAAQAMAQRLGLRLRDMSHFRPLPQPGTLEVWLAQH